MQSSLHLDTIRVRNLPSALEAEPYGRMRCVRVPRAEAVDVASLRARQERQSLQWEGRGAPDAALRRDAFAPSAQFSVCRWVYINVYTVANLRQSCYLVPA